MNFLFSLVIAISIIFVSIEFIRVSIKILDSYNRQKQNKKIIDSFIINIQHISYLKCLCNRQEVIYRSYILHNSLNLISSFFSLKYSIATFATSVVVMDNVASWKDTVLSVLSMLFVVINICVKPRQHSKQYLLAWREYDEHTKYILQHNYNNLTIEEIENIIKKSINVQSQIEKSLKYDENDD